MRVGDKIYYSSRINEPNATIQHFEEPVEIITRFNYFTVMPASSRGYLAIMAYGEDINNTWIATANTKSFKHKIKEGDIFWLDGDMPPLYSEITEDYGYLQSATALVSSITYSNLTMSIVLKSNPKRNNED